MNKNAAMNLAIEIEEKYEKYGINVDLTGYKITNDFRYIFDVKLKKGTHEDQLYKRAGDVQTRLKLPLFRVGKKGLDLYIVVSEHEIKENSLMKIIHSPIFTNSKAKLPYAMGYDEIGNMVVEDLTEFPQLLVGGLPKAGKSTALRSMILSMIYKLSPDQVNFILFDVGAEDLTMFGNIPHLSAPIIKDVETAIKNMTVIKEEMERRIPLRESDPAAYQRLPYLVCIVDEFVSLISSIYDKKQSKMLINIISGLIMRGRHGKVHLVLATQDPTAENMKINISSVSARIAFMVSKYQQSMTIIGEAGAEKLQGKGAMLFKYYGEIKYLQGSNISIEEAKVQLRNIIQLYESSQFDDKFVIDDFKLTQISSKPNDESTPESRTVKADRYDTLMPKIIMWSLSKEQISTNAIQSEFRLSYAKAKVFIDKLEELNFISEPFAKLPRTVLPESIEDMTDTMEILLKSGYSIDAIEEEINKRVPTIIERGDTECSDNIQM